MCPSTPLQAGPDSPHDPSGEEEVVGIGDTERPPAGVLAEPAGGPAFVAPEPRTSPAAGAPASAERPLRAALPRPAPLPAALPGGGPPSSSRLVAAPPSRRELAPPPSSDRMPVAAPAAPSSERFPPARSRAATMLHAGSPPVTAPGPPGSPAPEAPSDVAPSSRAGTGTNPGLAPEVALTRRCTACDTRYPSDFLLCPRDASPLVDESGTGAANDPMLGRLLGETYQIVRVVGEGGMGRVYEARHLRLKERRFAVKTLHADLAKNKDVVARFLREAESASSLSHPNVVDVFDVHHLADGTPYFVGEFLVGEEVADYVTNRGPLEPRMAAAVGRQICRALTAAHARGIVHRDMKPENVFVLKSSIEALALGEVHAVTVKVLDFGISKAGGSERENLTRTGMIMGTPSFMSPEQALGKSVDLRSDVYSTGAVLYFMLTGKRPFDSDDPTAIISMVLTQDPPRPRSIDARIPENLELIVQKAMAKEARDRFQTMAELERALAGFEGPGRSSVSGEVVRASSAQTPAELGESGAQRAFDLAKRVFAASMPPPAQSAGLAVVARPTITIASVVLGTWLVGGTTAALAGLVRVLHEGEVTLTESVLLVVGCLFAAATPAALYVMHVKKVIWPNSVRALQLASDLTRTAAAALVTYGGLSIVARLGHTLVWRSSEGLASGWWDIVLFLVSVVVAIAVGGFAPFVRDMRRRRAS